MTHMTTNLLVSCYHWILLSVIVWVIATTIARARVFRPLRAWAKRRSDYFGEGISCQYCISHWIGFAVTALFRPELLMLSSGVPVLDYFVHAFAVIGLSALIARTIGKSPPDGVLHPDEKARRENEARQIMEIMELERVIGLSVEALPAEALEEIRSSIRARHRARGSETPDPA